MPDRPNPLHVVLHRQMGIDSFPMDGDDTLLQDVWQDRPARAKTPPRVTAPAAH